MTALVAVETLLLVLLILLVAGLLRSHAEILRRLGPPDDEPAAEREGLVVRQHAPARGDGELAAPDVAGATLAGDSVKVSLAPGSPPTLLAFLTSGCTSCGNFWEAFGGHGIEELAPGVRVVAVTKDGSHESPSRLRELAPAGLPVLLSSVAWDAYSVPGSPYFVYVEDGAIQGEGSATQWPQLASLLRDARADMRAAGPRSGGPRGGEERASSADAVLEAAGIGPGHPSLYPASGRTGAEDP
jgi:hypothetical protein